MDGEVFFLSFHCDRCGRGQRDYGLPEALQLRGMFCKCRKGVCARFSYLLFGGVVLPELVSPAAVVRL